MRPTGVGLVLLAMTTEQRFWLKVRKVEGGCWEWSAALDSDGYGMFWFSGKLVLAHRFAYEQFRKTISHGMTLDHLCRNRRCVNPDHLEEVTLAENLGRGAKANQTHCVRGHEFTPENTGRQSSGARRCRACARDYQKQYYREVIKTQSTASGWLPK